RLSSAISIGATCPTSPDMTGGCTLRSTTSAFTPRSASATTWRTARSALSEASVGTRSFSIGANPRAGSCPQHAFFVERRECSLGIIARLERGIGRPAVERVELLAGKEALRVERLDAPRRRHGLLDRTVH